MPINGKVKQLYDALKYDGADVGTEQEFNDYFFAKGEQGYKNRKAVYDAFKSDGADVGENYEEFASWLELQPKTHKVPKTQNTPKQNESWWDGDPSFRQDQQQYTQKVYNPAEDNMGVGVGAAILQPKPVAQPKPATQPAQTQQQVAQAPQQPAQAPQPVQNAPQQQKQEPYKPTIQEQMAFGWNMGGVQNTIDNVTSGIDKMQQGAQKASPFGGNVGLGNNKNLRRGNKTFDAEKGAFVDTYLTSDGREFRDVQQANNAQAGLDEITTNVRLKESLKSIGIDPDIDLTDPKNVNHLLGEAYAERDALQKKLENDKEGKEAVTSLIMSGGYDPTPNDDIDERNTYRSALRMLDRRINALETARDNGGFWGGTADVLTDPSNYSFGLTDLEDSKQMASIKQKIDAAREKGEKPQLNESEKALVRNVMLNQQAEQLNKDNWWYNAGKGFGQTLSFMKDFALTGGGFAGLAKGGMALGGKVGTKAATKLMGDYMTKNLGTKALGKTMEYIGKGVGLAAGAEAGGFMLNNTAQAASNMADVISKQTGNLTVGKDGMLDFENSKNLGMAVLQSQIARTGENGSELVGLAFDKMPQILGRVIQKTTVGKTLKKLTENAFWKKGEGMLNYLGISSVWGEGMEEEYGMARTEILNRLTNGDYAPEGSGLFDLEKQLDTWKTVGLTSMVLRVPSMVATGTATANYYANKYNLNTSDKNLRYTFADYERYEAVKSMIDGADNQKIAGVLNNLMTNAELSDEEKQAMFLYANDLIKVRGFNIGNVVAAANGYKEPPKVSAYQVKADGKSFDELDKDGNVLAHHEYETNDEMKVGLYEAQQKRFDDNFQSDISILKSRPDDQFVKLTMDYWNNLDMPITYDEFMEILEKPSLERTDEEQQMIAPFADVLHNTVYDNTILHEEQSQQDGEDIAEADSIDIEEGGEQGAIIAQQWQEAQASRNAVFEQNEDLRQEVELMESQGLSHQEIISRLDWARPEQVQAVIDYYNAKAKFEGYVNRKAQKIDEEAANSRQRHTMKGTIDGKADLNNVYTITDGTNHYYLVSGDITTDPATGRITGSTSGLIIGMDLDGSFVNISDTSGYSLEPVTMTLDQFEEAERERLGQQITSVIDPNQTMGQQTNQPQPIQAGEQAGAQAGASTGTGANEAPAAPLSSEPQPIGTGVFGKIYNQFKGRVKDAISFLKVKKEGVAKAALNHPDVGDIDLVWGDNNMGLAHILNKHPEVANNLQNIIDGMEVVQQSENRVVLESDTHRAIISKDWNGQPMDNWLLTAYGKKGASGGSIDIGPEPTGGMQNGTAPLQSTLSESKDTNNSDTSQVLNVKVDKNGVKLYEEGTPIDAAIADIQNDGFDVNEVADASIAEAQQAIDKINGKPTKTRKDLMDRKSAQDVIDYYNNVKARWAEMNAEAQPQPTEQPEPEQPAAPSMAGMTVEEQKQLRIAEAKEKYGELFDDDFTKAQTAEELASMYVGRNRTLSREDLAKELGYKLGLNTDEPWAETLLAKKGKGMTTWEVAHAAYESDENPTIDNEGTKKFSDKEIHDALIDVFRDAKKKSDIMDYVLNRRIEQADALLKEQERRIEDEEFYADMLQDEQSQGEIPDSELPFAPATDEDFTNDVKEDTNQPQNDVTLQAENRSQIVASEQEIADTLAAILPNMQEEEVAQLEGLSNDEIYEALIKDLETYLNNEGISVDEMEFPDNVKEIIKREINGTEENEVRLEQNEKEATGERTQTKEQRTEVDEYLKPRNAEEEDIISGVVGQLQQEIQDTINEQEDAREQLEEARARESERSSDMFGNDNALNQDGQLFDNSEMPVDQSAEGIERRTTAERERLQDVTNRLNQLQSEQERNSRIRGALDNHRRQTKIETEPQPTSNPIEAIEQTAQQFKQEQEEKKAYGADNKLVSQDRYEELKKRMIKKLNGQLNAGFDPEILQIGAEMAMFHIEAGARKFADYATRMINDLGDVIRPYLKSFYEAARRMPGMEELSKEMDSTQSVDAFDVLSYDKQNDNTVNEHKTENNEPEKVVSSQQEASAEVERKPEDVDKYRAFSQAVANDMLNAMESGEPPYKNIKSIRAKAKSVGLEVDDEGRTDILLQELVEDGLVSAARQYVNTYMVQQMLAGKKAEEVRASRDLFNDIVKLYYLQPTISQRSSNRIKMQQYSTPLPMSFVADVFATPNKNGGTVLEPTAGNGMMVFAVPEYMVHANELDKTRLDNLRAQKFQKVTDQDATQPFEGDEQYDAIIANPPFGTAPAKDYDGKEIKGLDEQIALNALSKMKDDGKAAIIIGGNMEYAPNGAIKSDKAFFTYLYDHYNVKGVIDMDGKLYSRQGTTYPTRMILIDGRRSEEERAQSKVYPPTLEKRIGYKVDSFAELYDLAEQIRNNNNKTDGTEILRTPTGIALPDNNDASGNTNGSGRSEQPRQNESDGRRAERGGSNSGSQAVTSGKTQSANRRRSMGVQQPGIPGLFDNQKTESEPQPQTGGNRQGGSTVNNGRNGSADVQGSGTANSGVGLNAEAQPQPTKQQPVKPKVEEKRELNTEKLSYRPHNTAFSLESVAPAAMVEAMDNMLSKIEKEHGNIDEWVTKELGYDSVEDMHNALAAEQVDSVAMAIYQMKNGQGMIIGDQTGVGKGRQMAALIRWACRQGKKPVFITQKADLFSDIYRDLVDIGSGELRPFIFNSDGAMVDNNGNVVHKPLSSKAQAAVFSGNELPNGYDFAVLTYSQVNTGDQASVNEAKEAAKKSGERYQKKKSKDNRPKATPKATFLRALAKDNYMFLDESHTAAGKSNTGYYFQSILKTAKAVTFASATFAKRPDTMPMYAIRTAMSKAKVKAEELIKIIENGGVTLQEIMSRALTQAGQMVRRERDMSDVKTDWKTVDDPATVKKARDNYDSTIEAFNAIIDFQKTYVAGYLDRLSKDLADVASSAGMRQGTEDLGIKNVPFASKTYNYTKQLMLALKVDAIVDEVVKEIEAGRHPVIALENTMGSMLDDYAPGDTLDETTFAASLLKGLKGVLRYTITDEDGKQQQSELTPEQLGPDGEAAYHAVEDLIRESTSGIFISPLDAITEKLRQKGYKVGELTGRQQYVELDDNTGEYVVRRRTDKDKKRMQREFNNGALDVLILNKSASTGISLHASEKFSDQRQRTMIIAQPLADINDYMQMIGRIDRTGQVHRGYYINLGLPVPAEGRFLMMLSTKLKSLNANTTTSQESESNDVEAPDLLNKYGSKVVIEYLRDNPDIYVKMGEPLRKGQGAGASRLSASELDEYEAQEDDARKITGYVALLPTDEQDAFYNDVVRRYNELIKYLNDTDSNDLKISVLPLRAKTIEKQVSSEGADPKSDNPFAGNAYVELAEIDVLKKPMKADEVRKVIEQLNPGGDRTSKILDTVRRESKAKMDKENERYEAAKKRAEDDIAAKTEAINAKDKLTEEQKKEAIDKFASNKRQAVEESHNNLVNKIDANQDRLERYLKMFTVGDSVLVPDDLTTDTFMGSSPGIFCGFKAKDEGVTPSTTLAVFATLDGRRKIEVKLSDWAALQRINSMTMQNFGAALNTTLENWDEQIPSETRRKGFIMTGNILQAFADAGDNGRVPGQLVTYTDIDGNVHDGILMNQHWEPSQLKGSTVPIANRMDEIKNLPNGEHITSADGNVVIERYYRYYTISVPKSKKLGGQYYENEDLLDLVDGRNFYPSRGTLKGDIAAEDIEKAVKVLSDLGVQLKSDSQVQFKSDTGGFNSDETDPMKAINQAAESWRSSAKESESSLSSSSDVDNSEKKSVPLERRTLKSYTDKDENYHKGIEEELRDLESEISGRGADENQTSGQEVDRLQGAAIGRRPVNELRKEAAKLRAEISRRNQKKQDLRQKYNIDEKGNISLSDLRRMFHDFNTNKVVGKLFDKVADILEKLGVDFRFTDNFDALTSGESFAFFNSTFFNWDAYTRNRTDQEKAKTILHEMIHNVAQHILERYEHPERYPKLGELTKEQKRIAQRLLDIFDVVKKANLVRKNGNVPRGTLNAHEMLSEIADEEFRDMLDHIQYREKRTALQAIKEWFKNLLSSFGINFENRSVLGNLEEVLDDILDTYDDAGMKEYRKQRELVERDLKDAGYTGDITDYVENEMLNDGGRASKVEDAALLNQLENGPKEIGYRNVVLNDDGSMGSPMADKLGKKGEKKSTTPFETGNWEQSDEHPELADENGKIDLIKPDGLGTVGKVDYNPYIHIRPDKVNKQFKNAWERPNLVYVEVEYPQSELTSGYKAEKAKKSVGRHKWNGGELILSRWDKVTRIVPWEEVADDWVEAFKNRGVEFDIVPPKLLPILADRGVEILPPHKNMSDECNAAYQRFVAQQEADPMNAIRKAAAKWNISKKEREEHSPLSYSAKQVYNERLNRVETVFSEAYQDAMVSLKTAQNAIAKDQEIPDSQNAYMAENLMHGKNKNEQDLFNMQHRDPIIRIINKIMNVTGMNWGDVDRYVYTKSGLERNREFFVRDWLEAERNRRISKYEDLNPEEQDIYDSMAATIEDMFEDGDIDEEEKNKKLAQALQKAHQSYIDDMETKWVSLKDRAYLDLRAGDITFPDYLNAMDNFILDNIDGEYNPSEHDYSGFREMFGDEDGIYSEEEIISELMDTEDEINSTDEDGFVSTVDELWGQINEATRYGLERYRKAGMRSDEDIDRVEQMFHFYVPMRGFKAETGEDMYQYFTGKDKAKSYVGGLLKHAKGRGSEAEYPISTIFAMSYKAIADCNQNLVNQKFYRLCQANPNDLVVLSDSWAVYNEATGEWEESVPEIGDDMSEDEVREATLAWEEQMRHLALEHKAKKIKGKAEFDYKPMDKKNQSEHIVDVRINGQPKKMIVTSNPRMAQALNGQLRFEHGRNVFSRWNAAIKNMMATFFTSYSPTFALRNMARDWTHFRTMLGVREGHGYASQANKYYRQSLFKMVGLFKKYRDGTLDESKEMERDFKDFMDNGGITGFVFMQKIDDIQKEMENIYRKQKAGKPIRLNDNLWEKVLGAVEAMNEGIENNARFATYRASRHYAGRTKARSAYDAKEITVNFNRKGAGSKTAGFKSQSKKVEDTAKLFGVTSQIIGEGRIFFNATVQAIATTFKNFQNPDGSLNKPYIAKWAAKYALPPFMFGLALPMINKALAAAFGGDGDDDPYANLPEWVRRKNICIYAGNYDGHDYFITIPIGQELAAFLTLGDIAAGNTYASNLKPIDKSWDDEMLGVMNTFSPVDVDTKITKGGLKEDPVDEVIGRTFSVLAPLVAVQQNLGWTGRPIYREDVYASDKYNPEYQMVYQNTNPLMVEASKLANDLSGGDDVVRGKIQVNPAIVQYLWEQYTGGPGKVFSNTISIGKDAKDILTGKDNDFNIRKVEGVKAFVQQGDDRTEYYRTQAKYRKYLEDARKMKDAENGYKQAAATDPLAITKLEKMSASKEYVRMEIALEAEKTLSKIYKAANQAEGKERKELRKLYNEQMKEVVDMLDEVGK